MSEGRKADLEQGKKVVKIFMLRIAEAFPPKSVSLRQLIEELT